MGHKAISRENLMMDELYSLENAQKFNWSSISGNLNPERVSHLENYVVGKKLLDAGCGGGAYVEFLAQKGFEVTGIDKYEEFLQVAREKGRLGTYVQGDVTNLPFADKTFDCTYCFDVLEHVDDQLAIQELARVTSKRLIIAVPREDTMMAKFGLAFNHYRDQTHLRYYTEDYLRQLAGSADYKDIEIIPEGFIPFELLFKEMLDKEKTSNKFSPSVFRPAYRLKSRNLLIDRILKKLTDILMGIIINFDDVENILASYYLRAARYKRVNVGLIAVLNLEETNKI
jgi:ubiquinone/menaquinone biosynthesis C-methylase UbiE